MQSTRCVLKEEIIGSSGQRDARIAACVSLTMISAEAHASLKQGNKAENGFGGTPLSFGPTILLGSTAQHTLDQEKGNISTLGPVKRLPLNEEAARGLC